MIKQAKIFCLLIFSAVLFFAGISKSETISNSIGSFTAKIKGGEVELNWSIVNPANLYKFKLESKKSGTELFNQLSDVPFTSFRKKEESDSSSVYHYTFSYKPQENGVYFYRLSVLDISNNIVVSEQLKIGITEVPEFRLRQNNPNPFNPSTTISYQILVAAQVKLTVYSLTGQFVDMLVDAFQTPGTYNIEFNAARYSDISSGIYFYKLETQYASDIKKMIFTK